MVTYNCILVRYDELGLKSTAVKNSFIDRLISQIRGISHEKVAFSNSRVIIFSGSLALAKKISRIFGVSSASPALMINQELNLIKKNAYSLHKKNPFRISCQRGSKEFPMKSNEICASVGEYIYDLGGKVDLVNYKENIGIELFKNNAYIFTEKFRGFGGLPVNSQGKVGCIMENENDYLACLMMMNRGCMPVAFGKKKYFNLLKKNFPYLEIKYFKNIEDSKARFEAVVSGNILPDLIKDSKYEVFYPLIGIEKKAVKEKYNCFI
jgi:thiamine biosynthesis protein ThiI